MSIYHEWESIDDELFKEAEQGEVVQVSRTEEYIEKMALQNALVLKYLNEKYPDRTFRLSKWNSHDFGCYQEVEERVQYENDEYDEEGLILI